MGYRLLTDEQHEYFVKNHKMKHSKDFALEMNKVFKLHLDEGQIKRYRKNHRLHSGLTGRFAKGLVPFNKGKKFPGTANRTSFKKGQKPNNFKPIGSERFDKDGYVVIKVANPSVWRLKHMVIWEQVNGKVPKTHALIFKNQNKHDVRLENLMLIKRSELLRLNRKYTMTEDAKINEAMINIVKIEGKIYDFKKKEKK